MEYDPSLGLLPGDEKICLYIQLGPRRQNTITYKKRKIMRRNRRTLITGPLAGSISPTSFETTVNSERIATLIPQLKKHILAKTVLISKNNKKKCPV